MTRIVFLDTETTGLHPGRRAWEVGLIERVPVVVKHPDGPDTHETEDREHQWFIDVNDLDLGNAEPMGLKVGRFYDRHPQMLHGEEEGWAYCHTENAALQGIEALTRGAHLVGAVPNFDAEVLAARMRAHGICPSWHYHLCCVENLAVGYLRGSPAYCASGSSAKRELFRKVTEPPWKSDDLSGALGVSISEEDRHTALGDAKWARAIYDKVMDPS